MKVFTGLQVIGFLAVLIGTSWNCSVFKEQKTQDPVQIRVVNNTGHKFSNVALFSMKFRDLDARDTTEYKELKYDSLKHDPLIYVVNEGVNYGRYVKIPEDGAGNYTYTIDSLYNRLIYVSLEKVVTK